METQNSTGIFTQPKVTVIEKDQLRGIASVKVAKVIQLTGIRIIESREGKLFIDMPTRKAKNGDYEDIFHPLNAAARTELEALVLEAYRKERGQLEG